ncbi:hypothetical protein SDC9_77207 [bioreactor metagenome]|uniref:Uncharacterized protein n=1 Tax=bioreactor metagenome TaxID=1076179 RepID=A0A644YQU8_9ZZZZ
MTGTNDNIKQNDTAAWLRAEITSDQKKLARKLAKSKGMTFQGWLGQLIQKEISQEANR